METDVRFFQSSFPTLSISPKIPSPHESEEATVTTQWEHSGSKGKCWPDSISGSVSSPRTRWPSHSHQAAAHHNSQNPQTSDHLRTRALGTNDELGSVS